MGFIVFCDTNLGFNLAVQMEYDDTVLDLKRKFMTEHAAVFPDTGEVNILAIKANIKGVLYHLPDSLVVSEVFAGYYGKPKFLQIDAAPKVDGVADVVDCTPHEAKKGELNEGN